MTASRPCRGLRVRQLVGAVALATGLLSLAGCQTGMGVSALNQCGDAVEVRADDVRDFTTGWSKIESGQRDGIVLAAETDEWLYVQVRRNKDESPVQFTVAIADLPKPPKGVDDDVEIVLAGARCPRP